MIYLDSASTTAVLPCAAEAAMKAMTELYGNPSSLHSFGFEAEKIRENARKAVASAAEVQPEEIVFTSGGTGADNLALFGSLKNKKSGRIITSAFEHPAVLESVKELSRTFEIVYLTPENGIISPDSLKKALTPNTLLVSIMHVNNETGALNPISDLAKITKTYSDALFHTDAVQGFMKEKFRYSSVDMASFSAHKTGAMKGLGALYVKKGINLKPVIYGGGQEKGLFCGTENVPAMASWTASLSELSKNFAERTENTKKLCELTKKKVTDLGAKIITPETASPYIVSAAFEGYLAENIVHFLEKREIYVSTGSACSSKKAGNTYKAIGMENYAKSIIRISFCDNTTENDIETLSDGLSEAIKSIQKIK